MTEIDPRHLNATTIHTLMEATGQRKQDIVAMATEVARDDIQSLIEDGDLFDLDDAQSLYESNQALALITAWQEDRPTDLTTLSNNGLAALRYYLEAHDHPER